LVDWGDRKSAGKDYRRGIECLNRSTLAAVDAIVARHRDAIILIEGDHGPGFGIELTGEWSTAEIRHRFPILNAQRLPPRCSLSGARAAHAVNTFRVVLACITGREPKPLSPHHFVRDHESGRFEEISDSVLKPTPLHR
jgi:hypothetical protein